MGKSAGPGPFMKNKNNEPFMNLELKTAAVHKSFSGNVTLAMFLSSHGDGFGADYQVPLVHECFSATQVLAQSIKYHFPKDSGQVLAKKANPTLFMNYS